MIVPEMLQVEDPPPIRWPNGAKCAVMLTFDFDAETLRIVSHALHPSPSPRASASARRGRSPREIRRQLGQEESTASPSLALQERQHIERTLERCGYNLLRTAQALGIARSTLYERIKDYGIKVPSRSA